MVDINQEIKKITLEIARESLSEFHIPVRAETPAPVIIGGLYLSVINNRLVGFIILRELFNGWYECSICHTYTELAYKEQITFVDFMDMEWVIEPELNFYMKKEEIQNSSLIETLPQIYLQEILEKRERPQGHKEENDPYRDKLLELYSSIIRDYHLRVFIILDELEDMEE